MKVLKLKIFMKIFYIIKTLIIIVIIILIKKNNNNNIYLLFLYFFPRDLIINYIDKKIEDYIKKNLNKHN